MLGKHSLKLEYSPRSAITILIGCLGVLFVDALFMWWGWTVLVEHFGVPKLGYWDMYVINLGVAAVWPATWVAKLIGRELNLTIKKEQE